jgi:nitrile hydratase accessory protein
VVAAAELERRQVFFRERPDAPARAAAGPLSKRVPANPSWQSAIRESALPPRFAVGDAVVTRHSHPHGHTRLPRYARGKRGVIARFHGVHRSRAVGMAVALHEEGLYEWDEFRDILIRRIAAAEAAGGPFVYYEIWLATFEELLSAKGILTADEVEETTFQFEFGERDDVF